jgi:hypothetical protein
MIKLDPITHQPSVSPSLTTSADIGHPNVLHNYFSSGQSRCVKESSSSVISRYSSSDSNKFENQTRSRGLLADKVAVCHLCSVPGIDCLKPLFGGSPHKIDRP